MSNRIDFFQPVQSELALAGVTVSVLLDGTLCPNLELIEIMRDGWPEFSRAKLVYNPSAYPADEIKPLEEIEPEFAMGRSISIRRYFNGIAPGAAAFSHPVFEGQIEGVETNLDPDGEMVEIIARDFSAIIERITVYGQRVGRPDGATVFLASLDTAFNPDGIANANPTPTESSGNCFTTFCAEPSQSKSFSYAEVIDYLLCEYLPAGQLQRPAIEQLRALTEDRCARDLDVTGLSLTEALHRCCERIGVKFKFVPRLVEHRPRQAIVFYKNNTAREVEISCQLPGETFSISKTNISTLSSRKNFWPVTHKYIGQGDFKVYEATFDLVKGWDPADEDIDYDKFSPSTNPDFYKVKDVFRKWCLNEAGDYSGEPFNRGVAFDFSKIFESSNYTIRRRRFWLALTTDKQGKSIGYFLQVSFDDGLHWWQYLYAFNNLLDECGVWLSSDRLDPNTWVASLKGVLKFRITASVISDERLSCEIADGPVNSTVPVVERVITLPGQFKYQKVSGKSIFANLSDDGLGVPDEVNDTDALYEFLRYKVSLLSETIETIDVQTPTLVLDYEIGDRVSTSPQSRDPL
ncbi:MAG: hypothetical protein MUP16_02150, partial [Sedimentisphaerales bacterium]|nr:hypothetical protein [Sedimentisphaerales bacterium]